MSCSHRVVGKALSLLCHAALLSRVCCVCWRLSLQLVMETATAGGRPSSKPTHSGSGTNTNDARKAAAATTGDGCETLEHLSASALLQLFRLADATQQLGVLFAQLPLDDGSMPDEAAQSSNVASTGNVVAAIMPRLPQLLACTNSLLQQSCFKEAQVMVECLALLGKNLGAPMPASTAAGQPQQKAGPAYAALSNWAHEALQQEEPEVKSVPLVRGLLELYIRYHGERHAALE